MAALTLDHLSGGRFVLGLGVSGPQVVEGWYGQPFPEAAGPHPRVRRHRAPGARPREAGDQRRPALPAALPGRHRAGQAAEADRPPAARRHPDHPGGRGPEEHRPGRRDRRRLVPHLLLPRAMSSFEASLDEGFARPGRPPHAPRTSRCWPSRRPSSPTTSRRRPTGSGPMLALYIGGMGAKEMNFHFDVFARMGYEEAAPRSRTPTSTAARTTPRPPSPPRMVEDIALIGPGGEDPRRPRGLARVAAPPPCSSTATSPRCAPWPSSCSAEASSAGVPDALHAACSDDSSSPAPSAKSS